MKKTKVVASMLLAAFAMTSVAGFAQGHDDRRGPPPGRYDHDHGHGPAHGRGPDRGPDRGPEGYRPPPGGWHKGERIPMEYRDRQYVVDNWREHRLSAPPRGYQWVGVGGDYFLIGVATGVVLQSLIGH